MFYFESDKAEIRGWIQSEISDLKITIQSVQNSSDTSDVKNYVINQLSQANAEYSAQIAALKSEMEKMRSQFQSEFDRLNNNIKSQQDSIAALQAEIATLKSNIKSQQNSVSALKIENTKPKPEIKKFRQKINVEVKDEDTPEKIFYLPEQTEVFMTNDRSEILSKVQKALNVEGMQKFLSANDSDISRQFQKLLDVHKQELQNFISKLNLDNFDDEELSEGVTAKYFKLFQHIIFDNMLVAIKRGVDSKTDENFYLSFLEELNNYLVGCGIYSVNIKSGKKVSDDDYKNMSPQVKKISDKSKDGIIQNVERVPYRINYLDDFNEKKYFQYNGTMTIYKAV